MGFSFMLSRKWAFLSCFQENKKNTVRTYLSPFGVLQNFRFVPFAWPQFRRGGQTKKNLVYLFYFFYNKSVNAQISDIG
jgi:hypothetical protein